MCNLKWDEVQRFHPTPTVNIYCKKIGQLDMINPYLSQEKPRKSMDILQMTS